MTSSAKRVWRKWAGYILGWTATLAIAWIVITVVFMACSAAIVRGASK